MSYDLYAFRLPPGREAAEYVESGEYEDDNAPPTAEEREAMERLAAALLEREPAAIREDLGDGSIEIVAEPMTIGLYARSAGIELPYWFDGDDAAAMLERAYGCAEVLGAVGGYTVFDPQTEEVVSGAPGEAARRGYEGGRRAVRRLEEDDEPPRRRFWKRR